ncbi:hypothetical protein EF914_07855 [Streptomyces sp. WAC05458]|uniref:hypothetical protein n=1 Tax=Streptomyces sp. WAC05458 TaxID=2487412 RepID=UPI000FABB62E|nr:hypothetical protein [Streptomyces sp. WAC05458]RSS24988.1 hypothetical protein EF914_07855 [Streptomyces sp. WAC05458]
MTRTAVFGYVEQVDGQVITLSPLGLAVGPAAMWSRLVLVLVPVRGLLGRSATRARRAALTRRARG